MRQELVDALASADARTRARAAKRVAAMRDAAYVPALLHAAARNDTDLPLVVDALGRTGDARALPLARALAEKKLLSRRRSGVEALRALGDGEGVEAARARGRERLGPLAATLDAAAVTGDIDALVAALRATTRIKRGDALDTCYELGDAFVTMALYAVLRDEDIHVPHMLRYTKSILKRAILRDDAPMLGLLAYRIDVAARAFRSTRAELKSGLDGVKRSTRVFGTRTSSYLRRAILRHLRTLARHAPEKLSAVVAEMLVHYRRADAELPRGLRGPWGRLLVLSTIVYGADETLVFDPHTRWVRARDTHAAKTTRAPTSRLPVAALREDTGALARLFRDAEAPPVLDFVVALVAEEHARLERVRGLDAARRIDCGHTGIERLAEALIVARYRDAVADVQVIGTLLSAKSERGRGLGEKLLDHAFTTITRDTKALGMLFGVSGARNVLGALVERGDLDASSRDVFTRSLLGALEHADGDVRAFAAELLVTRLADDVRRIVDRDSALTLARDENEAKVTVAAFILADMPEAHRELGLERVRVLARSSSLALRGFALMILAHADVQRDEVVAAWVAVAEGDFADVSVRARDVLRGLSCASADAFPLVMRLVDSTTPAVRALGIEKLTASEGIFATDRTLMMLAEHPDRDVRAYAVHLAAEHLREGLVPLLGIEALVRATLGESLPDARAKRTLLELLAERATRDEGQAEVIARWLSPYAPTRTVRDRERIVSVLARIESSFPGVVTPLSVTQ